MKVKKTKKSIGILVLSLITLIAIALYIWAPKLIPDMAYINWLALLLVLVIMVSPWGSIRLKSDKTEGKKSSFKLLVTKVVLLEAALLLLFYGITLLNTMILPIEAKPHTQVFGPTLSMMLIHFGLFPWSLIAIFATGFGLMAFVKNQDSYLSSIALLPFKNPHNNYLVIVNNMGRNLTGVALAISTVMVTFTFASMISGPQSIFHILGFSESAMGAVLLMAFLTFRRSTNQTIGLIQTRRPAFGMLLTVIIWSLILALAAFALNFLTHGKSNALSTSLLSSVLTKNWHLQWHIFSLGLLFAFVPLISIFVARYSYGHALRSMIIATLILPLILGLLILGNQHFHWINHLPYKQHFAQTAAIVGFILLIYLTCKKSTLPLVNLNYLAKPGDIKPRKLSNFFDRWKKLNGLFFYLFIPAGIFVISLLMMLALVIGVFISILVFIGVIMLMFQAQRSL